MRRRRPRAPRRALLLAAVLVAALTGGWFAVRDAPFVAVERVSVRGATGPDADAVRRALTDAAKRMTTLHVDGGTLHDAVARYPTVADVEVDRDLPNGLTLRVRERPTVAAVVVGGKRTPMAADGDVLEGARASRHLPTVAPSGRSRARVIAMLAAAPAPLLRRARRAYLGPNGLTLAMREGPTLYFGRGDRLAAKWASAARVLAHPDSEGARYVDVRVPERAAAGGLVPSSPASGSVLPSDPPAQVEVQG